MTDWINNLIISGLFTVDWLTDSNQCHKYQVGADIILSTKFKCSH